MDTTFLVKIMNTLQILVGIFLVSFGLVARSSGLRETRGNSRYSRAIVWFSLVSAGALIILDGVFL